MTPLQFAQLAVILAPVVKEIWMEGEKVYASFKENISQEDLNKALEASKSAGWPALDFGITK